MHVKPAFGFAAVLALAAVAHPVSVSDAIAGELGTRHVEQAIAYGRSNWLEARAVNDSFEASASTEPGAQKSRFEVGEKTQQLLAARAVSDPLAKRSDVGIQPGAKQLEARELEPRGKKWADMSPEERRRRKKNIAAVSVAAVAIAGAVGTIAYFVNSTKHTPRPQCFPGDPCYSPPPLGQPQPGGHSKRDMTEMETETKALMPHQAGNKRQLGGSALRNGNRDGLTAGSSFKG